MTRPIKFRAWREGGKIMLYGIERVSMEDDEPISISDIPNLMQFTGLHDKNGKEIYEGDILKEWQGQRTGSGTYLTKVVMWQNYNAQYVGFSPRNKNTETTPQPSEYDLEIIGNIYENPELLTSKK